MTESEKNRAYHPLTDEGKRAIRQMSNKAAVMEAVVPDRLLGVQAGELWDSHSEWQQTTCCKISNSPETHWQQCPITRPRCTWFVLEGSNSAGREKLRSRDSTKWEMWFLAVVLQTLITMKTILFRMLTGQQKSLNYTYSNKTFTCK